MSGTTRARILRFTLSERAVHWIVAIAFFSMLVSGIAMGRPRTFQNFTYTWHIISAGLLVIGLAAVIFRGDRRALRATSRELRRIDALDRRWLASVPRATLGRASLPSAGRFNGGQKINFLLVSSLLAALLVSGLGLIATGQPASPVLKAAHVAAAYLAAILVVGHLYMALINPSTRPALRGIITGHVDASWLLKHHSRQEAEDATNAH